MTGFWRACCLVTPAVMMLVQYPLHADDGSACGPRLQARFVESAPRDRFEFTNDSTDGWSVATIAVNLEASAGRLIFDTTDGGKGVDVFQPFRRERSEAVISTNSPPADGSDRIEVEFFRFDAGQTFNFSIDVDDQLANSDLGQIRVADSEIAGATISVEFTRPTTGTVTLNAVFDTTSQALVVQSDCT